MATLFNKEPVEAEFEEIAEDQNAALGLGPGDEPLREEELRQLRR